MKLLQRRKVMAEELYYLKYTAEYEAYIPASNTQEALDKINEIKDIQWLTEKEALHKIRDYQTTRKQVISRVFQIVNNFNCKYFVVE